MCQLSKEIQSHILCDYTFDDAIWYPEQSDLQNILLPYFKNIWHLNHHFYSFIQPMWRGENSDDGYYNTYHNWRAIYVPDNDYGRDVHSNDTFKTFEQCWLAFFMWHLYKKRWYFDGEQWIYYDPEKNF